MPKNTSFITGAKNRMVSLFRSLAPYTPFNKKSTRRSGSAKKNGTRKGGAKNWKGLAARLRNEKVVKNSKLNASAEEFKPNFHSLRLPPKNSNANFTRKENKKMENALFKNLRNFHKRRTMRN
jgi:hypothetical protein